MWQLDGSRGFHALSRDQRWMVVTVIAVPLGFTGVGMLWIVGAVLLVVALSWFARAVS